MLRTLFVIGIIMVGVLYAVQGPFYALLFYLWYAYFRPDYWLWYNFVTTINLSWLIGIFTVATSVFALQRFRFNSAVVLILLFFAQSGISLFASQHFDWSFRYWIDFTKVVTISILITFLVTNKSQYRLVLIVIGYSLGLEAAKQGWAQLVLSPGTSNQNPHPMLGDNNGVAVGMAMLIPVFVALAQTANRRWEKYLHRFFVVGVTYRALSTYSRGGLLAILAVGAVAWSRSRHKIRSLVVVVVVAAAFASVMPDQYWNRMETITADSDARDSSALGRLYFWRVAIRMAQDRPLTGVGFNAFRPSFGPYDPDGIWGDDRAAHSAWFGVMAEMGYPGLVLLMVVLVTGLRNSGRIRRATRKDPAAGDLFAYAGALQASFVAYIVGMTFLNGQYTEMFWHFVGMSAALVSIHRQQLVERNEYATAERSTTRAMGYRQPAAALPTVFQAPTRRPDRWGLRR